MAKHHPDLIMCRKLAGIAIGRLCEKCEFLGWTIPLPVPRPLVSSLKVHWVNTSPRVFCIPYIPRFMVFDMRAHIVATPVASLKLFVRDSVDLSGIVFYALPWCALLIHNMCNAFVWWGFHVC
eukprot:jgi/Botrbrau1/16637/Bobra.0068s0056.1